uniref:Uncharacterized protein n=1 Tax=Arundo donax TaxID=35708 RepID=A0A0A9DU55_ARUDO
MDSGIISVLSDKPFRSGSHISVTQFMSRKHPLVNLVRSFRTYDSFTLY